MIRLRARDEGMTLTELLVIMALMGIVLAGAWSVLHVVQISVEQNNEQSWISQEIAMPLENAERMFSQQAPPLQEVGPYLCRIRTDQDRDNLYEYHAFEATADGRFVEVFYEELGSSTTTATPSLRTWSDDNVNRSANVPMFKFYDINGVDISGETAVNIIQKAASVEVTIIAEHDGRRYTDSRQVFFRNR